MYYSLTIPAVDYGPPPAYQQGGAPAVIYQPQVGDQIFLLMFMFKFGQIDIMAIICIDAHQQYRVLETGLHYYSS